MIRPYQNKCSWTANTSWVKQVCDPTKHNVNEVNTVFRIWNKTVNVIMVVVVGTICGKGYIS